MPERAGTDPALGFADLPPARRHRLVLLALLRAGGTTTVMLLAYGLLPFTLISQTRYLTAFLAGLLVVVAVLAAEVRRTLRSPYPRLRAVEALTVTGPLFLVLFAALHYVIAQRTPSAYTEPMTRLDALYYTVTTFATVGYGDISPVSPAARLLALLQVVGGLIMVGLIARILLGIAQHSRGLPAERARPRRDSAG